MLYYRNYLKQTGTVELLKTDCGIMRTEIAPPMGVSPILVLSKI